MAQMQKPEEASVANSKAPQRKPRVSMSIPTMKMAVPSLDGYRLHWFAEENVPRALDAYYEFVDPKEVTLNQFGVGANPLLSGNTDLGTRVSIIGSLDGPKGGPQRAYLMKLKMEYFLEDEEIKFKESTRAIGTIFQGEALYGPNAQRQEMGDHQYIDRSKTKALFNRGPRKAKIGR